MNKILVLVPTEELVREAQLVQEKLDIDITVKLATSPNVLTMAREAAEAGAMIAVARGHQAYLLSDNAIMPLVEIVLSGQEIARMIHKAKAICGKERPVIGFVGYQNMFSDTKAFETSMNVTIVNGFVNKPEEIVHCVRRMKEQCVDILIGGTMAIAEAEKLGMVAMFIESYQESMITAIKMAQCMLEAVELEKKNTQEMMALLNYSLDAIIRTDNTGRIQVANYMAEKIFRRTSSELMGNKIQEYFDSDDAATISRALSLGKNTYSAILHFQNTALVANIAAITGRDGIEGSILSMQEFKTIDELEMSIRQERYFKGYVAERRFEQLHSKCPSVNQAWEFARRYAKYDLPVLLQGELGTGKRTCAECIHNASMRKKNPFVSMDCAGMPANVQSSVMLGQGDRKGLLEIAHMGTIYINHIEQMDAFCQYQLLRIFKEKMMLKDSGAQMIPVDVRIVCGTDQNLYECVQQGVFNEQLYCLLTQLEVNLPALSERKEDIPDLVNELLNNYCTYYRKYITLTEAARAVVYNHNWQGNMLQLSLFLEKLVIVTVGKLVDVDDMRSYLPTNFRKAAEDKADAQTVVYASPEADEILRLLVQYNGNRGRVAEELKISKSTLWRKIKKYGIGQSFHK